MTNRLIRSFLRHRKVEKKVGVILVGIALVAYLLIVGTANFPFGSVSNQKAFTQDLLVNGNFESWVNDSLISWNQYSRPTLSPETSIVANGSYSLKMESKSYENKGILQKLSIPPTANGLVFVGNFYFQEINYEEASLWFESNSGKQITFFLSYDEQIWLGNSTVKTHLITVTPKMWCRVIIDVGRHFTLDWSEALESLVIKLNVWGNSTVYCDNINLVAVDLGDPSVNPPIEGASNFLFDSFGAIEFKESVGFVFLVSVMLLFSSEIAMLIFKNSGILDECDFIEKLTYVLLIGAAVVTFALETTYILGPFVSEISLGIFVTGVLLSLFRHKARILQIYSIIKKVRISKVNLVKKADLARMLLPSATLVLLGIFLYLASSIFEGYYGSTNFDASHHSLTIRSYLDMNRVTERLLPFHNFIVRYPRGPLILGSFATIILDVPEQKIVAFMILFFFLLNLLALYTLGKTIFRNQTAGMLTMLLGSFSWNLWGPISWGGLPFIAGLFATSVGMSFTLRFIQKARHVKDALLLGLILYFVIFSYPTSVFFVFVWLVLCLASVALRDLYLIKKNKEGVDIQIKRLFPLLFIALLIGICLSGTFLLTIKNELHAWMSNPSGGSFPETILRQESYLKDVDWVISVATKLNPFNPFEFASFSHLHGHIYFFAFAAPFLAIGLWFLKRFKRLGKNASQILTINMRILLVYLLLLVSIGYLRMFTDMKLIWGFPAGDLIDPIRVFHSFFIPLSLLSVAVLWGLSKAIMVIVKEFLIFQKNEKAWKLIFPKLRLLHTPQHRKMIVGLFILISVVVFACISTAYSNENFNVNELGRIVDAGKTTFGYFNRLHESDIVLMQWMKHNLPADSVIFINWQDGGEYVSTVTGLKAIYVLPPLYESTRYQQAVYCLAIDPLNRSTIDFLVNSYNASYIYVGAAYFEPWWNPNIIAVSPYFQLVKRCGDSFLFKILLTTN